MKYLLLLLTSLSLQASLDELDLTLPEQPAVYIPPEKEFFLNLGDYNEPPTKGQMILFWTLNALDVYTTYEGLKQPGVKERNPLLGEKPHLDNLLIQKAIIGGYIAKNGSQNYITLSNTLLTLTVINNYNIIK
jgi:hypothetical protein